MDYSPQALRARFDALTGEHDAMAAVLEPLRAELNAMVAGDTKLSVKAAQAREAELRGEIKERSDALYPIEMERAALARALKGQTGEPASTEAESGVPAASEV